MVVEAVSVTGFVAAELAGLVVVVAGRVEACVAAEAVEADGAADCVCGFAAVCDVTTGATEDSGFAVAVGTGSETGAIEAALEDSAAVTVFAVAVTGGTGSGRSAGRGIGSVLGSSCFGISC